MSPVLDKKTSVDLVKLLVFVVVTSLATAVLVVTIGNLTFDQAGRVARVSDRNVELSAREIGLLEILIQRAGRLVSKEQIVDHLCEWGEEVSHNAIEVYVHRLRKKIEDSDVVISTVRGLGYCLQRPTASDEAPSA